MPKRSADEMNKSAAQEIVNLSSLPDPPPEGRIKDRSLLKRMQIQAALEDLAAADKSPTALILDPTQLSFKWKAPDVQLLVTVIQAVGLSLNTLDLSVSGCRTCMPPSIARAVIAHCPQLRVLGLKEAPIESSVLGALGQLTQLQELRLGGIAVNLHTPLDAAQLHSLACCTDLRSLELHHTDIPDTVVAAIAKACTKLTEVDFTSSPFLTEDAIMPLASNCPHLESLTLLNCKGVGPAGVAALGQCHELRRLDLQDVRVTTALGALCAGCPALWSIKLAKCTLTDQDMHALVQLPRLAHLDLNASAGYSPKSLTACLKQLEALQTLSLNGIRFPGKQLDTVLIELAENGSRCLLNVDLNNSTAGAKGVAALTKQRPECKVTTMHCNL